MDDESFLFGLGVVVVVVMMVVECRSLIGTLLFRRRFSTTMIFERMDSLFLPCGSQNSTGSMNYVTVYNDIPGVVMNKHTLSLNRASINGLPHAALGRIGDRLMVINNV